jgi:hypothetical protein
MTVRRLLTECDSAELTQWIAWYRVRAEAEQPRGGRSWPALSM